MATIWTRCPPRMRSEAAADGTSTITDKDDTFVVCYNYVATKL